MDSSQIMSTFLNFLFLNKLIEKSTKRRLQIHLTETNPLKTEQPRFSLACGVETTVVGLISVYKITQDNLSICILLDLSEVFNPVKHKMLLISHKQSDRSFG